MGMLSYYFRKSLTVCKDEVLVLPSRVAVGVFVVTILVLPLFSQSPYLLRILILSSIFAIFAASWDLLSGFTGQMNFGHALFFGVGAYSAALLNIHGHLPPWASIPLGALGAVLTGLIVGIPCLRLRGTYLALTTLAFPVILLGIIFAVPDITGGELGLSGLSRLTGSRLWDYYLTSVIMLVSCAVMWKITDSNTGIIFHAIREDELAVRASGINTIRYKLLAFSLGGFFAGISGGLYAHFMRIAGPSTLEVSMSFTVVIWAVFGGIVTIYGPVGAVFILFPLLEFLRFWPEYRTLAFALVILLILLYMPEGLFPYLRDKLETQCPRCKIRNVAKRKTCRICAAPLN
ncbi:MAG: branched-chain amino acid ABC transporter permease [Deltaproteobacteria bacterium CG_4_8_14_3_um_filter_51_11]|nr:MAG: branched-chain amino acid ABC transporter permease [Desulfobacteraceae bacterium CG2_30_51_40]PIP46458.1 MAG: branched-chain amino acid ABC transporter permease [Deltaproteobacteria bacterium CG23_combo_of_CG06-09_8_20_14_all_51_20]PIX18387.1 MAG: branched-chain amino acid ABC transporter permease [Deltaproteobacteria bacterium CG_4_8_14_3_um_filter_51_11]PIY26215.1 MAG: branched-chain amino acid ABC transporter permease [Deltaproteobacteria bacterium CG_4_10_14_3_um_filter_51_14]PJB338